MFTSRTEGVSNVQKRCSCVKRPTAWRRSNGGQSVGRLGERWRRRRRRRAHVKKIGHKASAKHICCILRTLNSLPSAVIGDQCQQSCLQLCQVGGTVCTLPEYSDNRTACPLKLRLRWQTKWVDLPYSREIWRRFANCKMCLRCAGTAEGAKHCQGISCSSPFADLVAFQFRLFIVSSREELQIQQQSWGNTRCNL